jgi:hypothetical protein
MFAMECRRYKAGRELMSTRKEPLVILWEARSTTGVMMENKGNGNYIHLTSMKLEKETYVKHYSLLEKLTK